MPSGPEGEGAATQVLPAGRNFTPKGPNQKTAFWFLCRRSGGTLLLVFFPMMERTKDHRGPAPRSASTPVARPRTPLRGTLPGQLFRASGAGGSADCPRFRAAAAGWDLGRKPSGWTRKARLVHAAVGAGSGSAGGETPPLRQAFGFLRADSIRPYENGKTWERPQEPFPRFWLVTGAEAKRSFAESSLPSFLSRKRAYFS